MKHDPRTITVGLPLQAEWLNYLVKDKPDQLATLYHPKCVVDGPGVTAHGSQDVEHWLRRLAKHARRSELESLVTIEASRGHAIFETRIHGPLGAHVLRHTWLLEDGLIREHLIRASHVFTKPTMAQVTA